MCCCLWQRGVCLRTILRPSRTAEIQLESPECAEKLQLFLVEAWLMVSQWPLADGGLWPQRPDLQWPEPGLPRRTRAEIRGAPLLTGAVGPETSFSGSSLDGNDNTYSQHSLSFCQNRVGWRYDMMAVLGASSGPFEPVDQLGHQPPLPTAYDETSFRA